MKQQYLALLAAGALTLGAVNLGCDDDTTDTRTTGQKVDDGLDKAGDKIERGVEKTGDALEKAGDKIEEGYEKTKESAKELGRDIRDGVDRTDAPKPATPPTTRPAPPIID